MSIYESAPDNSGGQALSAPSGGGFDVEVRFLQRAHPRPLCPLASSLLSIVHH
jgi:hypothetical protein